MDVLVGEHTTGADDKWFTAFVDVLGFSSVVEKEFDRIVAVYDAVIELVEHVDTLIHGVRLSVFSDAFIVRSPSLGSVIQACQIICWQAVFNELLVRGGIGYGRHSEIDKNGRTQLVSQALVHAARIEKSIKHPCVALDESILLSNAYWRPDVPNNVRALLYYEGMRIVNPCSIVWGTSARCQRSLENA